MFLFRTSITYSCCLKKIEDDHFLIFFVLLLVQIESVNVGIDNNNLFKIYLREINDGIMNNIRK
jgi:hypothetical protein